MTEEEKSQYINDTFGDTVKIIMAIKEEFGLSFEQAAMVYQSDMLDQKMDEIVNKISKVENELYIFRTLRD